MPEFPLPKPGRNAVYYFYMAIVLLVLGILLFIGLVIVHELGHFWAAKRNGVEVEEFGLGFPPRAWSKKTKGGWLFSVNWLPIGGFVKLKGENDADKRPGSLGAASTWVKSKIMLAGVVMNLLIAFVLLTILGWVGMPQLIDNQYTAKNDTTIARQQVYVARVTPGSPAAKAGLESRDQLLSITPLEASVNYYGADGRTLLHQERSPVAPQDLKPQPIDRATALPELTQQYAGQKVRVAFKENNGATRSVDVTLRTVEQGKKQGGILGITPSEITLTRSTWTAPFTALRLMGQFTVETFQGLGRALSAVFQGDTQKASEEVSGPIGIVFALKLGSFFGIQFLLMVIAIVSLSLAIMNVLPIPALDGGRLFVILLSRLFKRQISEQMEERIVGSSFIFLLFLIALITIVDVKRFF